MAAKLLRKIEITFSILCGIGLIKIKKPHKFEKKIKIELATSSTTNTETPLNISSTSTSTSATSATPATSATSVASSVVSGASATAVEGEAYSATTTLFELDKEQDLILGNYGNFTLRMANAVHALQERREVSLISFFFKLFFYTSLALLFLLSYIKLNKNTDIFNFVFYVYI